MIKGRIIICVASSWDYDPTSKHQIMKVLSRHNDIVWVNYHGTRRPAVTVSDLKAGCSVLRRFARGVHRINSSMIEVTPLVIPGVTHPSLARLHQWMVVRQIRRAVRSIPGATNKPVQVWSFAPDVPYLVGRFNEECFVYYCVDEHSEFAGMNATAIRKAEGELLSQADIVVTTSRALLESKRVRRPDAILLHHGVDFDTFASAWRKKLPRPAELASIPKPIFGFFGLLHFWIDVPLIEQVAKLRPGYSFVLIGDCREDVSTLRKLSNVHLLGRRRNEDLPAYCAEFAAGLLPFMRGAVAQNANPIKMYEYLAAGLPVVSTPLPEAERFLGPIVIAETVEQFARACDGVLAGDSPGRREVISRYVEGESWLSKVEHLSDIIQARSGAYLGGASKPRDQVVLPGADIRKASVVHG
ncbi:MAG: glycosyltransferase [Planctomycetes bacterium]|nr:glycosyltransferase [Planctomycetota bacterium]